MRCPWSALGRAPLEDDELVIDGIVEALAEKDYNLRELMVLIATSAPFRERMPDEDEAREAPAEGEGS